MSNTGACIREIINILAAMPAKPINTDPRFMRLILLIQNVQVNDDRFDIVSVEEDSLQHWVEDIDHILGTLIMYEQYKNKISRDRLRDLRNRSKNLIKAHVLDWILL